MLLKLKQHEEKNCLSKLILTQNIMTHWSIIIILLTAISKSLFRKISL